MSVDGSVRFGFNSLGPHVNKALVTRLNQPTGDFQDVTNIFVRNNYMSFTIKKTYISGSWNDNQALPAQGFVTLRDKFGGLVFATVTSVYVVSNAATDDFIIMLSNPTSSNLNQLIG